MSDKNLMSYCRKCGGKRHHLALSEHPFPWHEDDAPIDGNDIWSVLQCAGCRTVTFCHTHWFSEEYETADDGNSQVIVHRDLYPPSPPRPKPEWGFEGFLALNMENQWVLSLHSDIYAALGMNAYLLAAMGTRTLVEFVITSKVGEARTFGEKLDRMRAQSLISDTQRGIISAAFDAGSAAAHRGHTPTQQDAYVMLDIAEGLIAQFFVEPSRERQRVRDAERLKANTPPRIAHKAVKGLPEARGG
jgi:hypothetical protein